MAGECSVSVRRGLDTVGGWFGHGAGAVSVRRVSMRAGSRSRGATGVGCHGVGLVSAFWRRVYPCGVNW